MQHLAGDSPETTIDDLLGQRREAVRDVARPTEKDEPWFAEHLDALPAAYLNATPPQQAAADLRCSACARIGRRSGVSAVAPISARNRHGAIHRRHVRTDHARHFSQAHRRAEQPRPGNPLGADSHPARRTGARPLLGPRSRLCRRAAAASGSSRSSSRWSQVAAEPERPAADVPPHVAGGRRIGRCACPACPRA